MKLKFIYVLLLSAFALIVLQSRSGGAAANNLGDRTGSPLSGAAGCSCHNNPNSPFSTALTFTVRDASQNAVTSYNPGQAYTIEFNTSAGTGAPAGYGLQAVALLPGSGNAQAGTLSVISSNTQITPLNGRSYIEHSGVNTGGTFLVNWTAPVAGSGTVAIYARGIAVNGSGTGGDEETASVLANLTESVPSSISYGQSNYCVDGSDPTPSITGTTGGTFTAAPAGLSINASTGEIDLSASTPQAYTITYDDGAGGTFTAAVTVDALDDAQFTYTSNFACMSSALTASPNPATSGGTWSSTTGLSINASTGAITPNTSTIGSYVITHTTNGACPSTETSNFDILGQDVAAFPFTDTTFCRGTGPNPSLAVTGTTSGFYSSSPAGLVFVSTLTGEVNIQTSSAGTYLVTYFSNGSCPTSANANVTIAICSGVETLMEENAYEVFPNPNNGVFSIKSNRLAGIVNINVVDILGKVVHTERSFIEQNSTKTLALENLSAGTYFVQLQQDNKQQIVKIIVE